MPTISLSESTEVHGSIEPDFTTSDARLKVTLNRLAEVEMHVNRVIGEYDETGRKISDRISYTEKRLSYLQHVHSASLNYWTIIGSAVAMMFAPKVLQGSWALWDWINDRTQEKQMERLTRRLHPRDWGQINEC